MNPDAAYGFISVEARVNHLTKMVHFDFAEAFEQAKTAIHNAFNLAGCPQLVNLTTIEWGDRITSTAEDARTQYGGKPCRIRLSRKLWVHMTEKDRYETAVHEACHIIAEIKAGPGLRVGHGWRWKMEMMNRGLNPERCHSYDPYKLGIVKNRRRGRQQRTIIECLCGNRVGVGPTQLKRMRQGTIHYRCPRCKSRLKERGTSVAYGA